MAADLAIKEPCRVATTGSVASLSTLLTVDGVTVSAGDRVLVRAQSGATQNGIYVAASGAWSRATDFDGAGEVTGGTQIYVQQGDTLGDIGWRVAGDVPVTPGANDIAFEPEFIQAGAGAIPRALQAKARDIVNIMDFGAAGDGTTDDTDVFLAAIAALRPGGTLWLGDGYSFLLSKSLVLQQPINIRGGSKEQTVLLFEDSENYETIDGKLAAIIALHSSTVLSGYSGDARRSVFSGLTVKLDAGQPEDMRGFSIHVPCYFYEVDANDFTSDGFAVTASNGTVLGNANGSTFANCTAYGNGGHGFIFDGSDANACLLTGCRTYVNGGWGFYDSSLLGNVYLATEATTNAGGGYFAESGSANRSTYLGSYAESPGGYSLNALCVILGAQGELGGVDGVSLQAVPSGDAYLNQALTFAATQDIANSHGGGASPGAFARLSSLGLDLKPASGGLHFKIGTVWSYGYVDFYNGPDAVIRFANTHITGNIISTRPFFPNGFVVGEHGLSGILGAGSAAPTSGSYAIGAIWLDDSPSPSGKIGWVCTTGGSPGTWKAFGAIDA